MQEDSSLLHLTLNFASKVSLFGRHPCLSALHGDQSFAELSGRGKADMFERERVESKARPAGRWPKSCEM